MSGSLVPILKGAATYVLPPRFYNRRLSGTDSARYCYSVHLRHLIQLAQANGDTDPVRVAELGPGASIGIGLSALIAGAERYNGLDIKDYDVDDVSREVFEQLLLLFEQRAPIPDDHELPGVKPRLSNLAFPEEVLNEPRMDRALNPDRIDRIRRALKGDQRSDAPVIRYIAPWMDSARIEPGPLDWIFSQAVMEHVDDLDTAYACCARWLAPGGIMTHQIDFRSHGTTSEWNGHWAVSDFTWQVMRGRRSYLINRQPYSTHVRHIKENGFVITASQTVIGEDGIPRSALATRFWNLSDEDFATSGAFLVARAPMA